MGLDAVVQEVLAGGDAGGAEDVKVEVGRMVGFNDNTRFNESTSS